MTVKLVISEQPRTTKSLLLYARKDGNYDRPIRGSMIDIRMEDMPGISDYARSRKVINQILPLPPIGDQAGKFAIFNFGSLDKIIPDGPDLQALIATNKYLVLPDSPRSELWSLTKTPWWEYAEVMDEYDGIIKAALYPRPGELTADEIDERLDDFEENVGKLEVLSPLTLQKQLAGAIRESYLKKLKRI